SVAYPVPAPPKLNTPVYSLATANAAESSSTNMNIVTYATPVSIEPSNWVISLYQTSLSYENFVREGKGVLQLLTKPQKSLVPLLGKSSGREVEKCVESCTLGFEWEAAAGLDWSAPTTTMLGTEFMVLPGCNCYLAMEMLDIVPSGDHDVALCRLASVGVKGEGTEGGPPPVLSTQALRDAGII
ncbi:unnamed protein product, partial [Chrysoparadoxa australica]